MEEGEGEALEKRLFSEGVMYQNDQSFRHEIIEQYAEEVFSTWDWLQTQGEQIDIHDWMQR